MTLRPYLPMNKIGVPPGASNRNQASAPIAVANADTSRSDAYTYFTKNDGATYVLYNGDRRWVTVTLILRTGGPVAVGTRQSLGAVTSGGGVLLNTNEPRPFIIAKGTKLYVAASAVSRVSVQIEPIPWLEEIVAGISAVVAAIQGLRQ